MVHPERSLLQTPCSTPS